MPSARDVFDACVAIAGKFGWGWSVAFLLTLALAYCGWFYWFRYRPLRARASKNELRQRWMTYKYKDVWRHIFNNETVPLDGFRFHECEFNEVTMAYQGNAPVEMVNCKITPYKSALDTNDPVVLMTMNLMHQLNEIGKQANTKTTFAMRDAKPWEADDDVIKR
jgi:hypothetical protein